MFAPFQGPDFNRWYRIEMIDAQAAEAETKIPVPVRIVDVLDLFSSFKHSSHQTQINNQQRTTGTRIRYGFIAEYGGARYRVILLDPVVCLFDLILLWFIF